MSDSLGLLDLAAAVPKEEWDARLLALSKRRRVRIISKPSEKRAQKERDDEKSRKDSKVSTLGENGLQKLGTRLAEAMAENEAPPPDEMLKNAVGKADVS